MYKRLILLVRLIVDWDSLSINWVIKEIKRKQNFNLHVNKKYFVI